jgi:hypothetical protein
MPRLPDVDFSAALLGSTPAASVHPRAKAAAPPEILMIDGHRAVLHWTRFRRSMNSMFPSRRPWIGPKPRLFLLVLLGLLLASGCGPRFRRSIEPVEAKSPQLGSWTLVALPDTQIAVQDYPEIFGAQIAWIAANAERLNTKYVVHLGDITNNSSDEQWSVVDRTFRMLDGRVPYALALGNHDYPGGGSPERRDTTKFDGYFPPGRLQAQAGFVGMRNPDSGINAAYRFEANGQYWLILTLEFGPRDTVLDWAATMLAAHPTDNAILVTHGYLFVDGTRFDHIAGQDQYSNPHDYNGDDQLGEVNDAQEMWDKLIDKHPNIRFVLCGHMHAHTRLTSQRVSGPPVHQLLSDYQAESLGGAGHLRLMTFSPDGKVEVKTYSPYLQEFDDDPDNDFVLEL